jgi:hypothetical protein
MNGLTETTLLDLGVQALQQHGLKVLIQKEPKTHHTLCANARLRVGTGKGHHDYVVEVKRAVTPATLGAVVTQLRKTAAVADRPPLLVTSYITPSMADQLKGLDQQFADAAGNAYLTGPGMLVFVTGRKPEQNTKVARPGRAFATAGLKVTFALLCNPALVTAPHRAIATAADVALGVVPAVLKDLQQLGYVGDLKGKRGTRRLFNVPRLLAQWAETYAHLLRPRTLIGRYYVQDLDDWEDWHLSQQGALWGGEPAAAILTEYLRPGELTIYAQELPGTLAARQKFRKEAAPGQTAVVEVRKHFWNFPADPRHPGLVPPLLVYADLLATGDGRCIETAKMIYDENIVRLFTEN